MCRDCDLNSTTIGLVGYTQGIYDCYIIYKNADENVNDVLPAADNVELVAKMISATAYDIEKHFTTPDHGLSHGLVHLYPQMIKSVPFLREVMRRLHPVLMTNFALDADDKKVDLTCVLLVMYPTPHLSYQCDVHGDSSHALYKFTIMDTIFDIYQDDLKIATMRPHESSSAPALFSLTALMAMITLTLANRL